MKSPANFYLVGAAKAGTTSLCNYLGQHPQIYMSPVKELNFFADEVRFSNFDEAMQRQAFTNPDFRLRGPAETWPDYLKLFAAISPHFSHLIPESGNFAGMPSPGPVV